MEGRERKDTEKRRITGCGGGGGGGRVGDGGGAVAG